MEMEAEIMADEAANIDEPCKEDISRNIDFVKKHLEGILSTCELSKLENDLCKALESKKNDLPEVDSCETEDGKILTNIDVLVLILKHICKSKNSLLFKQKKGEEEFFKQFSSFVVETTKERRVFSLVDFLEGIAKYSNIERRALDDLLEKSSKEIKEASEYNMKEKTFLCRHIYFTLHCVLSSNEMIYLIEKIGVMPLKIGISNIIKGIVMLSRVPQHKDFKDICILDDDSMHYFHKNAFNCLRGLNFILQWMSKDLKRVTQNVDGSSLVKIFIKLLLKSCIDELVFVVMQHIGKHNWTSTETRVESQNLLSFLLRLTHSANMEILLSGTQDVKTAKETISEFQPVPIFPNGISKLLLENIYSKVPNNGWKRDPSLIHIIAHVTTNIKYPNLKPHINILVPMLLEVIGDYRRESQILGIECLGYLIDNVTASDLNLYNHAELIYEAFFKFLYGTTPTTLRVLLPCLQKVLYVLEPFPDRLEPSRSSKWDETLQKLISNLEYENTSEAREVVASNLSCFITTKGINCARFLLSILKATNFCLEMYDNKEGRIRKQALNILNSLIVTCWPIMWRYAGAIMKMMLKVLIDISMKGTVIEEEAVIAIKEKTKEIIMLLSKCCGPDLVLDFLENAINAEIGDCFYGVKEFLRDAKQSIVLDES